MVERNFRVSDGLLISMSYWNAGYALLAGGVKKNQVQDVS
jgi:hypothetical protein